MKFEELNLHNETLQALNNSNNHQANQYEKAVIDAVKSERDIVFKTSERDESYNAFAIAAVDQANKVESKEGTQTLILLNDKKAIKAIKAKIKTLQPSLDCVLIEEENNDAQIHRVAEGHTVVLASPNRLQTILKKNRYIFRHLKQLVLGSFDEMISSGEEENLRSIKKRILSSYTTLISTNVFEGETKKMALKFTDKPKINGFGPPPPPQIPEHLKQRYINVPPRMKISTLMAHLNNHGNDRCVVFTNSKRGTDRLYRILKKQRMKAVSLHYKLSDERRAQRLANFTNGNVQYLLVSDISAAELDATGVSQLINYDVPANADEYRYRSALVDNSGQIISLVSKQDQSDIEKLQKELGSTPEEMPLPEKVKQKLKERKQKNRSNGQNGQRNNRNQKRNEELELPKPTFDQLSGGRNGHQKEEEKGIVTFFKKLFS